MATSSLSSVAPLGSPVQASQDRTADRRLCAGTYLDREFRDHLLRDIYIERNRRVAPSHGFDVVTVLRHAWRAWWLEMCQSALTLGTLAVGLAVRPLDTLIALDLLAIWLLLRLGRDWALQFIGYGTSKDRVVDRLDPLRERQLQLRGKALKYCVWSSIVLLVVLTAASASGGRTGNSSASWPTRTGIDITAIIAALSAIVAVVAVARFICLHRLQSPPASPALRRLSRRMQVIDQQQRHPFIVHTEFKPFIGSGKNIRSWSFAQRLVRSDMSSLGPATEFEKPPFTAQKLVDRLKDRIEELRDDDNPETRLPGLTVTDHVFVDGVRTAAFTQALAGKPNSNDVDLAIADAIANPSDVARHYLATRIVSWGGEVVTSVFVHVSLQGRTLYLEFATYALFPVRAEYRAEHVGAMGAMAIMGTIGKGLIGLPGQVLAARRLASAPALLCATMCRGNTRTSTAGLRRDIGATFSARETAMIEDTAEFREESESSYFQYQDIAQHSKVVERQLIAAVGDFLYELGVDSSEFIQRTTAILNNGVMNTGTGTINIDRSAVGEQSYVAVQAGSFER